MTFLALTVSLAGRANAEMKASLLLGGNYSDYKDYTSKVGEFTHVRNDPYPEAAFKLRGTTDNAYIDMKAAFTDNKNGRFKADYKFKDKFSAKVNYQLFERQLQFDLLENMNAREMLESGSPGGKMISHEALDSVTDYRYDSHSLESEFKVKISDKYGLNFVAAHKMIMQKGNEQKISTTHCFSCHLQSRSAEVDRWSNQVNVGLEANRNNVYVDYKFSYRIFRSNADDVSFYYDGARHPVNGGSAGEFASRLLFDDGYYTDDIYPRTQKFSNKFKFKTGNEKRVLSGTFNYSKTTNDAVEDLDIVVVGGTLNYKMLVNPKTWLFANGALSKTISNDIRYDIPTWREGGTGGDLDIFDYYRASSLDRLYGRGDVQGIMKLNPDTKVSLLLGYEHTRRYDYPGISSETASNKYYGEGWIRYRNGLKSSFFAKYHLELTDDPFMDYRGLFEAVGRGVLTAENGAPNVYYYQREDLKYQNVTTLPTIEHEFELSGTYSFNSKISMSGSLKLSMDKNNDLDNVEIEHSSMRPNLGISFIPNPKWSFTGGYTYMYDKSRGSDSHRDVRWVSGPSLRGLRWSPTLRFHVDQCRL